MNRFTTLARLILWPACTLLCASALGASGCASVSGEEADERRACPEGRDYGEMFCTEIPRYARDPDTGLCCRYDSPCATPAGWKTYPTEDACNAASKD